MFEHQQWSSSTRWSQLV